MSHFSHESFDTIEKEMMMQKKKDALDSLYLSVHKCMLAGLSEESIVMTLKLKFPNIFGFLGED